MFDIFQQAPEKKNKNRVKGRAASMLVTLVVTTLFFVNPLLMSMTVDAYGLTGGSLSSDTATVRQVVDMNINPLSPADMSANNVMSSAKMVSATTSASTKTDQASSVAINLKNRSGKLTTTLDKATKADFKLVMDGKEVKLSMPILVADGRTYLPLRALGEELLKAKVGYDEKNGIAIVNRNGIIVETFAGSNKVVVNGNVQDIDQNNAEARAFLRDDRTYLPLRALCENLGVGVYWDAKTQTIYMKSDGTNADPNYKPSTPQSDSTPKKQDTWPSWSNEYWQPGDPEGFTRSGPGRILRDKDGYDVDGYDNNGYDRNGVHWSQRPIESDMTKEEAQKKLDNWGK